MDILRKKIATFENWISSGLKGEMPDNIPEELLNLLRESGDAYSYYRNYLYQEYLVSENEMKSLIEFKNFLSFSNKLQAYKEIIDYYSGEDLIDLFKDKTLNIFEIASENSKSGISQNACFLYQSYYEIEHVLLALATFGVLNTENRVELDHLNLKDKSGRLKKGNCINFVKAKLKEYPELLKVFSSAYNTKLRNTIGHNNYRIVDDFIESIDGKISVKQEEFFKSLLNLQHLNNQLVNYFSSVSINEKELLTCGILSIGCAIDDSSSAVLVVHQLDCFYRLDKEKEWLDKVVFTIDDSEVKTDISAKSVLRGTLDKKFKGWLSTVNQKDKLCVVIQSIRPQMNDCKNVIEIDCGRFEELKNTFTKEVEYDVKHVLQHSV